MSGNFAIVAERNDSNDNTSDTENDRHEDGDSPPTGTKRKAEEDLYIDVSALEDSEVVYQIHVKKTDLAQRSPVFRKQFCGPQRKKFSNECPEILNLGDFSQEACAYFLSWMAGGINAVEDLSSRFKSARQCELMMEVYLLFDKYQVLDQTEDEPGLDPKGVMEFIGRALLEIRPSELFSVVRTVRKYKHIAATDYLREILLNRCAKVIHHEQLDIVDMWKKHGDLDADALITLNDEVMKHRAACQKDQ